MLYKAILCFTKPTIKEIILYPKEFEVNAPKKRENRRNILETVLIIIGILLILLIFGLIGTHQNPIEKRYGFNYDTPTFSMLPPSLEVIMIIQVDEDGAFDKAGFKFGDVIAGRYKPAIRDFMDKLDQQSGTKITLDVIPFDKFEPTLDYANESKIEKRTLIAP